MRHPRLKSLKYASTLVGAFFCLLVTACNKKKSTADWENPPASQASTTEQAKPRDQKDRPPAQPENTRYKEDQETSQKEVRFLAYNLKNYLTMRRYINGQVVQTSKPEKEIKALIDVIQNSQPDILGICEIGSDDDLKDFQARLKTAGIDLPHTHRMQGADAVRALAILSKYPIIKTATPKKLNYTIGGIRFKISRGILDATIQLPNRQVRFLGVHFKSKRPIKEADQELMRRSESLLLRQHIDDILTKSPDTQLLAYGDFNDTKRAKSVYTVRGRSNSPKRLEMLNLTDSRGENWTHNWKREDIYSRFDFAMVNLILAPHINKTGSKLLDPKNWELASDHRALLVLIK